MEQLKDSVLVGVFNIELMREARSRLTVVKEEWEIRNALDAEQKLMRTWYLDPRNPNCSLAGLKDIDQINRSIDQRT